MLSGRLLWDDALVTDMTVEKHRTGYHLTWPDLPDNMYAVLLDNAVKRPTHPALVTAADRAVPYAELLALTDAFAVRLALAHGVRKGMQAGLLLPNSLEFVVAFLALCKLGAVTVPLDPSYPDRDLQVLLDMANLKLVIAHPDHGEAFATLCRIRGIPILPEEETLAPPQAAADAKTSVSTRTLANRRPGREDPVLLLFTSGTTTAFRGALCSNLNLLHAAVAYQRLLGLGPDDRTAACQPFCHVTGLAAILCLFLRIGGTVHLLEKKDPRRLLQLTEQHSLTLLHTVPSTLIALLDHRDEFPALPSLRQFVFGGSNLPSKFLRELKSWLPGTAVRPVYGLTETTSPAVIFPGDAAASFRIGSSGFPIPGVIVKVADEMGRELPNGMTGELLVRGAVVMEGYYGSDAGFDGEGWFRTGDLARLTDDGHVYIVDRKATLITRDGDGIGCYEIENLLHECPGVREAAVVGIPDGARGEAVAALVTPDPSGPPPDFDSVSAFLSGSLIRNKMPSRLLVTDVLPTTPAGKVDKTAVALLFREDTNG